MSDHSVGFSEKPILCLSITRVAHFVIAMPCSRFCVTPQPIGREKYHPCPPTPAPPRDTILMEKPRASSRMLEKNGGWGGPGTS